MDYENHMGFIYSGLTPDFYCMMCGKVLVSFDFLNRLKECNPGRTLYKDKEEKSVWSGSPIISRKTRVVCPEHQAQVEDEGYYLAMWWGKDGMIHGTK